jgi:hypothetical protein
VSLKGMSSSKNPPFLLLSIALSIAVHSLGWIAWNTHQSSSASEEWSAAKQRAQPVVHIQLSEPPGNRLLVGSGAADTLRTAPRGLRGATLDSDRASNTIFFVPSGELDSPVVPMSAPDTSRLDGLSFSGAPIRLRLLIETNGHVLDVLTLQSAPEDALTIEHIKAMLQDTAYIPGRLRGSLVPAQLDLELQLSTLE